MKVIKDTIPERWETKDGDLSYKFGFSFGNPIMNNDKITLPIRPNFIFGVDNKEVGIFECENTLEVKKGLSKEESYKLAYTHLLASLIEFNSFARSKFSIPSYIKFSPPSYEYVRQIIMDNLKHLPL